MKHFFPIIFIVFIFLPPNYSTGEKFLLWESFEGITPPAWPSGWTKENTNGDGKVWETKNYGGYKIRQKCVRYSANPSLPANDWFFTPALSLLSGTQYTLRFKYKAISATNPEKLSVWFGTAPASGSMTTQIFNNPNITDTSYQDTALAFTVGFSGTYYLGFHCLSDANRRRLYVDDILISYPAPDLELTLKMIKPFYHPGANTYPADTIIECLIYIKNIGTSPLTVNSLFTEGYESDLDIALSFIVVNPAGETIPFKARYNPPSPALKDFKTLQPGEIASHHYDLNCGPFHFSPGTYTIQAIYKNYFQPEGLTVWRGKLYSNTETIIIQ